MDEDTKNNVDGNYIFNGDKANISIGINYQLPNMNGVFKVEDGFNQLYVDIDMKDFSSNVSEGSLKMKPIIINIMLFLALIKLRITR